MPMHRKAKRATVLAKRTQYMRKYYKSRSCRSLYEKLKNNNSYLAKALSQEKQNCETLFSQNIALLAEVQELRLACNTRDTIISNTLNNAKETLKMLVNMSGYVTNTISMCQEFASNPNLRMSSVSAGRKESSRRLSTKSPARGVVKPMVSGHTITKPTINLSRVNMQHINNPSRLSDIQEVSSPNSSQGMNEARSPIAVSIPITQLRYENGRTCRMPERLAVSSSRVNNTIANLTNDGQRIRKRRSHHSKRISGSYSRSRSNRWSGESARDSIGCINQLGSLRVKLNDVSKLLQNSQSINIRTLTANRTDDIETQESSDDAPHDTSDRDIMIPETQLSINTDEQNETCAQTSKKSSNAQTSRNASENSRLSQNSAMVWEDPLEGPSWLFNNTLTTSQNNELGPNHLNVSDTNNCTSQSNSKVREYNDDSSDIENIEKELSLPNFNKCMTDIQTPKKDLSFVTDRIGNGPSLEEDTASDDYCSVLPALATSDRERNIDNANRNDTMNLSRFVTLRRGHSEAVEEELTEDFTLMLSRQPKRNMHFDINELQLPILEKSIINPTINEIDAEVTTTIQRITTMQMPSMLNQNMNETDLDPTTTIKLPLILINDHNRISTPAGESKHSNRKNKKLKMSKFKDDTSDAKDVMSIKKKAKRGNKSKNSQDPSAAKVVLEKLDKTRIKPRTPSPDDTRSRSTNSSMGDISNREESPQDSESSNTSSNYPLKRPRRRKAPINLKEPNLTKKLRREC